MFIRLTACLLATIYSAAGGLPPPQEVASVSAAQAEFYRGALPTASRFVVQKIPAAMLSPADAANNTYIEAFDPNNRPLGYVRDFSGPVSPSEACACSPLTLTLIFFPDFTFKTLLAPAPLQKYGHEAMTSAEHDRLLALLKNPPAVLLAVPRVEDVVDATTGATRQALVDVVIPQAGLSTRRIVGLVQETQQILRNAPVSRDRQLLYDALSTQDAAQAATNLARTLPQIVSSDLRRQAYQTMANAYLDAPGLIGRNLRAVETRLLAAELPDDVAGNDLATTCYHLANRGRRAAFVGRCLSRLQDGRLTVAPELLHLLLGTVSSMKGEPAAAQKDLFAASEKYSVASMPELFLRLGRAYQANGRGVDACASGQQLYGHHPLMPGVVDLLQSCTVVQQKSIGQVVEALQEPMRRDLLQQDRKTGAPLPPLELEATEPGQRGEHLSLTDPNQVTVAVFFATWCPHCRAELPRIKNFVNAIGQNVRLKSRVRVLGIRTAVEKETKDYGTFTSELAPNFPIYTDASLSTAFVAFAKSQNIPAGLPTTAVIDRQGVVRFLLAPGDWRDTQTELLWAVTALTE